jgi:hypothetical protein
MPQSKCSTKSRRTVKVGCTAEPRADGEVLVPMIRLRGLWLARAGYAIGNIVDVIVADNEIRIICRQSDSPKKTRQGELF